jgi:hypothetical protein
MGNVPQWYIAQVSDTTMLPWKTNAGNKIFNKTQSVIRQLAEIRVWQKN